MLAWVDNTVSLCNAAQNMRINCVMFMTYLTVCVTVNVAWIMISHGYIGLHP